MYEIVLPLIGEITIWPYVLAMIVILGVWDHLPAILKFAFLKLKDLIGWAFGLAFNKAKDVAGDVVDAVTNDAPKKLSSTDPLPALQTLTECAVRNSTPEMLTKVVSLYADVQKQLRSEVK